MIMPMAVIFIWFETVEDVEKLNVRNPSALFYVTQTTLSMDDTAKVIDALRARFPEINGPKKDDICYATQNRQDAVRSLALECDLVLCGWLAKQFKFKPPVRVG